MCVENSSIRRQHLKSIQTLNTETYNNGRSTFKNIMKWSTKSSHYKEKRKFGQLSSLSIEKGQVPKHVLIDAVFEILAEFVPRLVQNKSFHIFIMDLQNNLGQTTNLSDSSNHSDNISNKLYTFQMIFMYTLIDIVSDKMGLLQGNWL